MTERLKLSLSGMWLVASLFSLVLPVFLPSTADAPWLVSNSVGAATAAMFLLSFPTSLFGLPLLLFANSVLGARLDSMEGLYVNLLLLFTLGLAQWFWIIPKLSRKDPYLQVIAVPDPEPVAEIRETLVADAFFSDGTERTPLERVIDE